jgi:hypothetical protein
MSLAGIGGCSGSGGGGGGDGNNDAPTSGNNFKPGFDFVFEAVDLPKEEVLLFSFLLDNDSVGQLEGNFDQISSGLEVRDSNNKFKSFTTLSGTFSRDTLDFVIPAGGGPGSTSYSGVFLDEDTIEITPDTPGAGVIILRRNSQEFYAVLVSKGIDKDSWKGTDSGGNFHEFRFELNAGFIESAFNDATALFIGEEDFQGVTNNLSGYFSVDFVTFTVVRAAGDETFIGKFSKDPSGGIDPDTIEFDNGLVIQRSLGTG